MIQSCKDKRTAQLLDDQVPASLPAGVVKKARLLLAQLDAADQLDDMKVPPGNKLHPLKGTRKGQHAVWINDKWRLVFRWENGNATDVEITDYHDEKK